MVAHDVARQLRAPTPVARPSRGARRRWPRRGARRGRRRGDGAAAIVARRGGAVQVSHQPPCLLADGDQRLLAAGGMKRRNSQRLVSPQEGDARLDATLLPIEPRAEGRVEGGHRGGVDRLRHEDDTTQGGGLRCGDVRYSGRDCVAVMCGVRRALCEYEEAEDTNTAEDAVEYGRMRDLSSAGWDPRILARTRVPLLRSSAGHETHRSSTPLLSGYPSGSSSCGEKWGDMGRYHERVPLGQLELRRPGRVRCTLTPSRERGKGGPQAG